MKIPIFTMETEILDIFKLGLYSDKKNKKKARTNPT